MQEKCTRAYAKPSVEYPKEMYKSIHKCKSERSPNESNFKNKPPLIPVLSSQVFNHLQIDFVTMEGSPVTVGNRTYKYIMILLDIFSQFLYLQPLQSKEAAEVAFNLLQIFSDAGPPIRIQSDQGSEFKGSVKQLRKP